MSALTSPRLCVPWERALCPRTRSGTRTMRNRNRKRQPSTRIHLAAPSTWSRYTRGARAKSVSLTCCTSMLVRQKGIREIWCQRWGGSTLEAMQRAKYLASHTNSHNQITGCQTTNPEFLDIFCFFLVQLDGIISFFNPRMVRPKV